MKPWFYLEPPLQEGETRVLGENQARHLTRVLRLQCGAELVIGDGLGNTRAGRVIAVNKQQVKVLLKSALFYKTEPPIRVFLAQSLLKMDKMDFLFQKAVELGVAGIIPIITNRSIRRWKPGEGQAKISRWQKIVEAAAAQSHRTVLPRVYAPLPLHDLQKHLSEQRILLVCWEKESNKTLPAVSTAPGGKEFVILIGPEGGLEPSEVSLLRAWGGKVITLGPRVLRAETAALTALALVLYKWGDLGGYD
jgi:16S rRNA (uracil1498-N3)-methyltransferase